MKVFIAPYRLGSQSSTALREKIKETGSAYTLSPAGFSPSHASLTPTTSKRIILNWGNCAGLGLLNTRVVQKRNVLKLNCNSETIGTYVNKLKFFGSVQPTGFRTPEATTSPSKAREWMTEAGEGQAAVVERRLLEGHGGAGIVVHKGGGNVANISSNSRLFTRYIKKLAEYRVHFSKSTGIFHIQKKLLTANGAASKTEKTFYVRNLQTGWVYSAHTLEEFVPSDVYTQCNLLVQNTSLDFGAIDVIYNAFENNAYILEVNTAPGLTGTTLEKYVGMLQHTFDTQDWSVEDSIYKRLA